MFTSVAVITLTLAIGANAAIFSIADAVLFKPLPYSDPDNVYVLATVDARTGSRSPAVRAEYLRALDDFGHGFGEVGLRGPTAFTYHSVGDQTEHVETLAVTPAYFRVLGVRAARGRLFEESDTEAPERSAVLTYESWQKRFGGDESLIGRAVTLGGEARVVIGVLPRGFILPTTSLRFLYFPTGRPEFITVTPPWSAARFDEAVVRLEPGATAAQTQANIDNLVRPLRAGNDDRVVLERPRAVLFPSGRGVMQLLVAAAAFVLLIGCANLANMLLARTRRREREIGLHVALGATPLRVIRPIVFETLIVGIAAALLAVSVTALTFDLLLRQVPPVAYGNVTISFDFRVAAFAMMLGVVAGLLFAVLPAWWSARHDARALVHGRLSQGSGRRGFGPMITAQVALAIVLVFGATITGRAFISVLLIPLGFSPDRLIVLNARPLGANPKMSGFYARAVDTLSRRADVLAASAGASIPPDGFRAPEQVDPSGGGQRPVDVIHVLPGYFETLGIPLIRGRLLTREDIGGGDVAVVSQSAAAALFPAGNVLGETFRTGAKRQFTVVGIVGDVRRSVSRQLAPPTYALPPRDTNRGMTLVARVRDVDERTLNHIRREIAALTPGAPVVAQWWSAAVGDQAGYRNPRFQTLVLTTFAALGLALTALGIFGAVTFAVAERTREMGVRLALGAQPRLLVRLVTRQALTPVAIGIMVGLVATRWLAQVGESQLIGVDARDPLMLAAVVFTVGAAAWLAAYVPARHVTRVDPIDALRAE
jgi:putative ABC transport system permease protein